MRNQNFLKSVSRNLPQPERKTRANQETFRGRIEDLSQLAAQLTAKLDALELLVLPYHIPSVEEVDFYAQVRNFEISLIKSAMKCAGRSQVKAANLLRLNPTTLNSKIKAYKIVY